MKKLLFITTILLASTHLVLAEEVTIQLEPKSLQGDTTATLDHSTISFKENPRKISTPRSEDKKRVLDFNGNDRFGTERPQEPKPLGEISHTPAPKPRPIYDIRRKEDVETVF